MNQDKNNKEELTELLNKELVELKSAYESLKNTYEAALSDNARAIKDLSEKEKQNRDLFYNAPVNYHSLNSEGKIINVNPAWLNSLGYSQEEVTGHHFSEFVTAESFRFLETLIPQFSEKCQIHDVEFEMIRKDGKSLIASLDGKICKDSAGNFEQAHFIWNDITNRKKTEAEIRIKDMAIESAIDAIAIFDLDGNLTYANPALYRMWGYQVVDEVIGKKVSQFWQKEETASEVIESLWQTGGWTGEISAGDKSGKPIDLQVSASMVKNLTGQPVCMLASFADITLKKQSEFSQSENEISYRELFNNVTDAIYIQDKDGTFLDVNEGAVKMYGYPREVLIGKNPLFVSAPGKNDFDAISAMVERAFAGEPQQFEFWGLRANGEIFPKEVRIINGTYFGQKVNIALAHDITERKQTESLVQASERRYRELIELAVDGILIGSNEGKIIGANSYMLNLTGRSLNNLIGTSIEELFSPEVLIESPLRYDLLKNGETVFCERDILRPDGTLVPIEMHTKMMPDGTYQSIYRDVTERKKSEEKLRESETKFKSLVESTSDMIWETNTEGVYTYISPQFENLLGYQMEDGIGESPFTFIADENILDIKVQSDSIVNKACPFNSFVNRYKHSDGHLLYFETSGVPVFDKSGKLTGYRGVSRDITKRHQAERELHKLSMVVHQSPITIIITALSGKIEYINPAGCEISGYSADELIGKNPSIFSSGKTPRETYDSLWKTIKSGKEWKGIFSNRKKNGEFYWESAFIVPLRDSEGKITNYLGVKEDVSKRIQAEAELKESEERFRQLFEGSPDAIILADIETGMLIDANTSACNMLGRPLEEIVTLHQTMIHPPSEKEISRDKFQEHAIATRGKDSAQLLETMLLRSDGTKIPVEVLASSIILKGKQILQGVFRDITDRKLVEETLLKAKEKAEAGDKLKSAFLNNISHELRTPLNGIIGFSEMLTQMESTKEDRIEFSKMIKRSSSRLINTINSYMDISMIVSGITEINIRTFSLNTFLDKINDQTLEICNLRNLSLHLIKKTPSSEILITTDENLLNKIFSQLIDNAIKFTKEGSVTIGYEHKAGLHTFSVSDTGSGIPEDALSVIFEVFMQADLSTSRGYEGSGLGLSIAQGFVQLLGGEIWVEANSNKGSTFCFTLPDTHENKGENTGTKIPKEELTPSEPLILVAEDEDSNYKYLEIVLRKASFKVIRATNGFETIDLCRLHPDIKILLIDMKMPGMDGFEATRQIRRILPDLPIVALSAFVSAQDENMAMEAGCNEYVIKPVSRLKLLETINRLLADHSRK